MPRDIKPLPFKSIEIMLTSKHLWIRTNPLDVEYRKYLLDILYAYLVRKKITIYEDQIENVNVYGSKTQLYNMLIELSIYFNIVIV